MSASQLGPHRPGAIPVAQSPLHAAHVYNFEISLTRVILESAVLSGGIPPSSFQYQSLLSVVSSQRRRGDVVIRPCIVVPDYGNSRTGVVIMPLTRLGGFDPTLLCCRQQHHLVPINDTLWPCEDSFTLRINPTTSWPSGDHSYVLAVPHAIPAVHYGLKRVQENGDSITFATSMRSAMELAYLGAKLARTAARWTADQKGRVNKTWNTQQDFFQAYKQFEAQAEVMPEQLWKLDEMYNEHLRSTHRAKKLPPPARTLTPYQFMPAGSNIRWHLSARLLQTFNPHFPVMMTSQVHAEQIVKVEAAASDMRAALCSAAPTLEILAELLFKVIDVAMEYREQVHPAFVDPSLERLLIILRGDEDLRKILATFWSGRSWPAEILLNFVYQAVNTGS